MILFNFFLFTSSRFFGPIFCAGLKMMKHNAAAQIHKTHLPWLLRGANLQHPLDCLAGYARQKDLRFQTNYQKINSGPSIMQKLVRSTIPP